MLNTNSGDNHNVIYSVGEGNTERRNYNKQFSLCLTFVYAVCIFSLLFYIARTRFEKSPDDQKEAFQALAIL